MIRAKDKTILLVEDEPVMIKLLADGFVTAGFNVLQAKDGEEGLLIALQKKPDLIILDISMPKMDGLTTMKKVRETEWGKAVPIIVLTNLSANDEIMSSVIKEEPSYYFMKTEWEIEKLVEKVKQELQVDS